MSRLNSKIVSVFENYNSVIPIKEITMFDWLTDTTYHKRVDEIRTLSDKSERDKLKSTLPAITLSATFERRKQSEMKRHNGLIGFDVDGLNSDSDIAKAKEIIIAMPYTVYCGLSVSGRGLWGFFEVAKPEHHKQYFEAMKIYFKAYNITIDNSCSDISRLRGYSYDLSAYVNSNAKLFDLLPKSITEVKKPIQSKTYKNSDNLFDVFNSSADVAQLLVNYGYKYLYSQGDKHRFTRPGKNSGVSVDFHETKRITYFFTSSTEFEPNKGYNPVSLFAKLAGFKDNKETYQELKKLLGQ